MPNSQFTGLSAAATERANQYFTALMNQYGLSREQAGAFVGGLLKESDNFNIWNQPSRAPVNSQWGVQYRTTQGSANSGIGDAQWTNPTRHDNFIDYANARGGAQNANSFATNWGYMQTEPEFRRAMGLLKNAQGPEAATKAALDYFRPEGWTFKNPASAYSYDDRLQLGRQLAEGLPGGAPVTDFSGLNAPTMGPVTDTGEAWNQFIAGSPGASTGTEWYQPTRLSPTAPQDPYGVGNTGAFTGQRAGGADVAGYDLSGLAFDRFGNPLGNTGISRDMQEGLRSMYEHYANLDASQFGPVDASQFAGRYAYSGDLRPQDAAFLDQNRGATITREGRYVLPTDYAPMVLGLDPDASDYAGRYDTPGGPSLQDALFLQQNPSFTLARGGANTGYGYRYDDATGSYVPNTTGTGGTAQPPGNFTPNPAPNTSVLGSQPAPSPADINGFNTPNTPYTPNNNSLIDTQNASTIGYNPSVPITNPSATASTIGGVPLGSVYTDPVVPSYGNPLYQIGNTSLGGSGVSPSTVGPGGVANPYGTDPNNMGGSGLGGGGSGPMVITVTPSSTFW
jgi:Phage tail lysozyme